jgi:adenylyltransferase/sulfurtransferase
VLVVGAGGLGVRCCSIRPARVGRLGIVDGDRLEPSTCIADLVRAGDAGAKRPARRGRVRALNPSARRTHALRSNRQRRAPVQGFDLVLDCSDNFSTKFLLNDVALRTGKPVLFASVYQFEGQLQLVAAMRAHPACAACGPKPRATG